MNQPTLTRRQLLAGTAGLTAAGLAGCLGAPVSGAGTEAGEDQPGHGEGAHGHNLPSEPKHAQEVMVNTAQGEDTTEFHFDPHVTWVEVGGSVTWELESGAHTATAYHPGNDEPRLVPEGTEAWDSGTLSTVGETYEHTFDTEGVYHYLCKPHEQFGMIATVIVGRPHLDDQTALQGVPEDKPEEVHGKIEALNGMVRSVLEGDDHEDDTHGEEGHHEEETHTEEGHHEQETHTEEGHHEEGTHTEEGHHEEETHTEEGHHEEETHTEDDH